MARIEEARCDDCSAAEKLRLFSPVDPIIKPRRKAKHPADCTGPTRRQSDASGSGQLERGAQRSVEHGGNRDANSDISESVDEKDMPGRSVPRCPVVASGPNIMRVEILECRIGVCGPKGEPASDLGEISVIGDPYVERNEQLYREPSRHPSLESGVRRRTSLGNQRGIWTAGCGLTPDRLPSTSTLDYLEGGRRSSNARIASSMRESSAPQGTIATLPESSKDLSTMQQRMSARAPSEVNSSLGQSSIRGGSSP